MPGLFSSAGPSARSPHPPQRGGTNVFAVFEDRNKQYRVQEGDTLLLDRNESAEAGAVLTFERVLFVGHGDAGNSAVGAPYVTGATVRATVVDHELGPKLIVGKFRRRKGYRRKNGHRQSLTRVRIDSIQG
ncbi:MAG: 50S ribosomal protein L21 [Planctomycetes bacterium]|nr:50S ribosomal protein L21 [Planctomycetota bacterium]